MPNDFYDTPGEWYDAERVLFDALIGSNASVGDDRMLQDLFDTAMFDDDATPEERQQAYDALRDYIWDEYGIDFDDVFDWEDYREWYDAQ